MRVSRFDWGGAEARTLALEVRDLQPQLGEVAPAVADIVTSVETEGDAAVERFERQFGGAVATPLRVPARELQAAPEAVPREVKDAIGLAISNLSANLSGTSSYGVSGSGPAIKWGRRDVPVAAAGAYVPGGAGAYPSTAVMCCVPAVRAEVQRIAVASPPGADGKVNPLVLAACAMAGATEVYAMGGAQAIAALALGTESVLPVDVIVGPGNRFVQEAKRQLFGRVGIDGIAGPSELMVVADASSNLAYLALDLCAQAEHGSDGLLVAAAAEPEVLDELEGLVEQTAEDRDTVNNAPLALVTVPSPSAAAELADAIAPEHLQLACSNAERLAMDVHYAGCVFIGPLSGAAFGDYAAGSNHVLPTGGAGRFSGPLGPDTFRRPLTTVELTAQAVTELAPAVATLADAEGFPVHGESALARAQTKGKDR